MKELEDSINSLKSILVSASIVARSDDTVLNNSISSALTKILQKIDAIPLTSDKKMSLPISMLQILEDFCVGKNGVLFVKSFSSILSTIYAEIIRRCIGNVVRTILNSMIVICGLKITPQSMYSKECAIHTVGTILKERFGDCGGQANDCVNTLSKLCRASTEAKLRIIICSSFISIIQGGGSRILDLHIEIMKIAVKHSVDKSPELRETVAYLLKSIVGYSNEGGVPAEQLLSLAIKGLEDENGCVQNAFAETVAAIFTDQINCHIESQEQAKVGIARGTPSESDGKSGVTTLTRSKSVSRLSIAKFSSQPKKIIESYELKAVVEHILKQITKQSGSIRSGYLISLGYLIKDCIQTLSDEDLEWLTSSVFGILHDLSITTISYEDMTFLRARISYLIRFSLTSNLSEVKLRTFAVSLTKFVSTLDGNGKLDAEIQLAFNELELIVMTLRGAAISVVDEIIAAATVYLRHANYGVRSAAASLLASLSTVAPVAAVDMLRNALTQTKIQAKQLLVFDGVDGSSSVDIHSLEEGFTPSSDGPVTASNKKKSIRDTERLQRMFFFHGHTLVISKIMKYADFIKTGIPVSLVFELFDLGLELLQQDVLSTPMPVRHVSCSIVRAGGLIISSCVGLGYKIARRRIDLVLQCCYKIFKSTDTAAGQISNEDMIYEIMCVEAALVCISTLLACCSEMLSLHNSYLPLIVDGLEICFRSLKGKYQPGFRTHFRFRTLHVILMECFSCLPHGFFPNSCQNIFVEALRVFRDSIAAGYECSNLSDMICKDHLILRNSKSAVNNCFIGSGASTASNLSRMSAPITPPTVISTDAVFSENVIILKLELFAAALEKKESEAFLSTYGKNNPHKLSLDKYFEAAHSIVADTDSVFSCAQIDSRTVDASIILLASTFPLQSGEYQDKAIQLCQQAVSQFSKPPAKSMNIFTSEDDKKKKDRKSILTIKNVISLLNVIVKLYPVRTETQSVTAVTTVIDLTSIWFQSIVDILFEMLSNPVLAIKSSASVSLGVLLMKAGSPMMIQNICVKLRMILMSSVVKKGDVMSDCSGLIMALSSLWCSCSEESLECRSIILTTIFDCLRKMETSTYFKAHCFLSLSVIVRNDWMKIKSNGRYSLGLDLIDEVALITDCCTANVISSDDIDLFNLSLIRLLNVAIPCALKIDTTHEKGNRLMTSWRQLLDSSTGYNAVVNECLDLLCNLLAEETAQDYLPFVLQYLVSVIDNRRSYKMEALLFIVEALNRVVSQYCDVDDEVRIDQYLFELLDYFLSCAQRHVVVSSSEATYIGLEIRNEVLVEGAKSEILDNLIHSLSAFLHKIVEIDVKRNPDRKIVHWVLLSRAIVLNLKSFGSKSSTEAESIQQSDENEDGALRLSNNDIGTISNKEKSSPLPSPSLMKQSYGFSSKLSSKITCDTENESKLLGFMTYQTYIGYCRDFTLKRSPDFSLSRAELKCVAMKCAAIAIAGICPTDSRRSHLDLAVARKNTATLLSELGNTTSESNLKKIPMFLPLFLNDVVNLACAGATYTVDDKPISQLQHESMFLIRDIIRLFKRAHDPDIQIDSSMDLQYTSENMILTQFLSQLLGAIRVCLATPQSPDLFLCSGSVFCDLIKYNFVTDPTTIKRLMKTLLSFCEDSNIYHPLDGSTFQSRRLLKVSTVTSEDVSTAFHLSGAVVAANLFILSVKELTQYGVNIKGSVREVVLSAIQGYLPILSSIWWTAIIDSARLAQLSLLQISDMIGMSSSWIGSVQSGGLVDEECNPLRGGIMYTPFFDIVSISRRFESSLPFFIIAYSALPITGSDLDAPMFSLAFVAIRSLLSRIDKISVMNFSRGTKDECGDLDDITTSSELLGLILHSQIFLIRKKFPAVADKSFFALIPLYEWQQMLQFVVSKIDILRDLRGVNVHIGDLTNGLLCLYNVLMETVIKYSPHLNPSDIRAFTHFVWTSSTLIVPILLPELFRNTSSQNDTPKLLTFSELSCKNGLVYMNGICESLHRIPVLLNCMFQAATTNTIYVAPFIEFNAVLVYYLSSQNSEIVTQCNETLIQHSAKVCSHLIPMEAQNIAFIVMRTFVQNCYQFVDSANNSQISTSSFSKSLDVALKLWKSFDMLFKRYLRSNKFKVAHSNPLGFEICGLIMNTSDKCLQMCSIVVQVVTKFIQDFAANEICLLIAETLLPAFVFRLTVKPSSRDAATLTDFLQLQSLIVRGLLLFFSLIKNPNAKDIMMELLLSPIAFSLVAVESLHTDISINYFTLCGKGLTQLARMCPESFKCHVLMLSEEGKATLQNAMLLSMQQGSSSGVSSSSSSVHTNESLKAPPVMKIDMTKYKK